ncbi:MAG: TIM-barrel domain-containing protein [Bacteroidales bacterium]|jgi:alpha-glucosidase
MNLTRIISLVFALTVPYISDCDNGIPTFPGSFRNFKHLEHGILITTDNAKVEILHFSPTVVRVRINKPELQNDFSYAVIQKPEGNFTSINDRSDSLVLTTDSLQVIVLKKPLQIKFLTSKGMVISRDYEDCSVSWQGTEVTCYKKLFPEEKFIGLGEKTGPLNRRGNAYINWNSDIPGYSYRQDPLYVTIPFYIGIHDDLPYGIFLDNSYQTKFNFGASTDDKFSFFSAVNGEMKYYFFGSKNISGIIKDYTWLTGRMHLPPYWSLGYQQCRWSYYPESEVLGLAQIFRDKKIPCDVIYLDIHYMDSYKVFTWNKERFPDPGLMISKINTMGFHLVTIIDPGIKIEKGYLSYEEGIRQDCFVKYPGGQLYTGNVWPGRCHFPDFTNPKVRDWWGESFTTLTTIGVEGFWNDMNEPSAWGQSIPNIVCFDFDGHHSTIAEAHNVYGLNMARATYEGTRQLLNNKRPFILTRAAYSGIQRYSAVWTGDNSATEADMMMAVRMVNSLGVSGVSFTGPDMGGFIGTPTNELFARWMSVGIYTPFLRNHAEINSRHKEPWSFGEKIEELSRQWINKRYRLLPYIYSAFYESTQTGLPVARTLAINYMEDNKIYEEDFQNEYLFGGQILVAPVSSEKNTCYVYFPAGDWIRMSDDRLYIGNTEAVVDCPLDDLPVFVKSGGIIPLQSVIQNTSETPSPVLEIHIYNGKTPNSFTYYEDDGITYNYETGQFYRRSISFDPVNKSIIVSSVDGSFPSKFSMYRFVLHNFGEIKIVNVNGEGHILEPIKSNIRQQVFETVLTNETIKITY